MMIPKRNILKEASQSWRVSAYILMLSFAVLTLFPLIWLFYSSFKLNAEIMIYPLGLPKEPTLFNYTESWAKGGLGIALLNSFIYTITATVSTMLFAMAAAFGLTKFPFKSAKVFTSIFAFGLMISVHAVIIPLFQLESKLGMINTRLGVIIPYIAFDLPLSIMIAISYVRGIPNALIESAEIDGAKYRYIFWMMIMPLSVPVIATMVILSFLHHWNEFLFVFVFTTKAALKSLPVAITQFAGRLNIDYGLQYASLVIGVLPMIVFYIIFHAQLIQGFGGGVFKE